MPPSKRRPADIPEDTRITAPNPKQDDKRMPGVIVDNLAVMYYIRFDNGEEDFVFKAQDVRPEQTD